MSAPSAQATLSDAVTALERLPAPETARSRLLEAIGGGGGLAPVLAAVEADIALTLAVLRLANEHRARRGCAASVGAALRALPVGSIRALAESIPVYSIFSRSPEWGDLVERSRAHALATHSAAERICQLVPVDDRNHLLTAALVHDLGRLAMGHAYPDHPLVVLRDSRTPEERIAAERAELGADHAAIGATIASLWGFPESLVAAIADHHDARSDGTAALVRLADMLAHYGHGQPVTLDEVTAAAASVAIGRDALGALLFELPEPLTVAPREVEPCPLSERELAILAALAHGKVYKQIAEDLGLSASTVRSHLHRIYTRIGATDRAQAVLYATHQGWI